MNITVSSPFSCRIMKILDFGNSRNCHHNAQDEQGEKTLHDGVLSLEFRTRNGLTDLQSWCQTTVDCYVRVGLLPEVADLCVLIRRDRRV